MSLRAPHLILRMYAKKNGSTPIHRGEGAAGDCGNLNPHNTKTVYFLRSVAEGNTTVISSVAPVLAFARKHGGGVEKSIKQFLPLYSNCRMQLWTEPLYRPARLACSDKKKGRQAPPSCNMGLVNPPVSLSEGKSIMPDI